jgi:hypothetical protein
VVLAPVAVGDEAAEAHLQGRELVGLTAGHGA